MYFNNYLPPAPTPTWPTNQRPADYTAPILLILFVIFYFTIATAEAMASAFMVAIRIVGQSAAELELARRQAAETAAAHKSTKRVLAKTAAALKASQCKTVEIAAALEVSRRETAESAAALEASRRELFETKKLANDIAAELDKSKELADASTAEVAKSKKLVKKTCAGLAECQNTLSETAAELATAQAAAVGVELDRVRSQADQADEVAAAVMNVVTEGTIVKSLAQREAAQVKRRARLQAAAAENLARRADLQRRALALSSLRVAKKPTSALSLPRDTLLEESLQAQVALSAPAAETAEISSNGLASAKLQDASSIRYYRLNASAATTTNTLNMAI